MRALGCTCEKGDSSAWPHPEILDCLIESNYERYSWRSDYRDPQLDKGYELFRRSVCITDPAKGGEDTFLLLTKKDAISCWRLYDQGFIIQ